MTDGLFNTPTEDVKPEKLPTIAQFVKRNKRTKSKTSSVAEIIWIPGKFRNYTVQTELFRVIISPNHPMYGHIRDFVNHTDNEANETGIRVEITDWVKGSYMFVPHNGDGSWSFIGSSGIRWSEP